MSQIDLIYAKSVEDQLSRIYPELEKHHQKIIEISKTQLDFYGGKTPTTPQDLSLNIEKYNKANQALQNTLDKTAQTEAKVQAARERAAAKAIKDTEKQIAAELKLQQAAEKAAAKKQSDLDKQSAKEEKAAQDAINASNRIIAQKEKEFKKFEREFNKYEADLARKVIQEERAALQGIKNAEKQRLAEIKLQQEREKAFDKFSTSIAKEEGYYNRIQAKINALIPEYNNLAAKRELGAKLTAEEGRRVDFLIGKLQGYQNILKKVDADIGKHTREVGNYAKANGNLSNSINQVSRELPNFGQSFSVGVLSLTNNVGQLIDSLKQVRAQNAALEAEGKTTKSVLSQVVSQVLSWQTALFIGIGIFSAYSKEIGEWVSNLWNASDALSANEKALLDVFEARQRYNNVTAESMQNAQKELDKFTMLRNVMKDSSKPYDERLNAAERYKKMFPGYLQTLTAERILTNESGKASTAYSSILKKLTEDLKERAMAEAQVRATDETFKQISELKQEFEYRKSVNDEIDKGTISLDKWKKKINDRIDIVNDDDDFVTKFGKAETDALGYYDKGQIQTLIVRYNALVKEYYAEKEHINKKYLNTSRLDFQDSKDSRGSKKDPWSAVLAARIRSLKQYEDASQSAYELEKYIREQEILVLDKLAKDEQRSFEDRIYSYGEMLQKKKDLITFTYAFETEQIIKQQQTELTESEKAHKSELKQAAGNAKAIAAINDYYSKEKAQIAEEFRNKQLLQDKKYSKEYLDVAEETAKAEIEITRKRKEVLRSTEKIYRDEQTVMFKKAADNEKLSVEIRQKAFEAYIALKRKELDAEKIIALAKAGNNKEEIEAIKARFAVANMLLKQEYETESPLAKSLDQANAALENLKATFTEGFLSDMGLGGLNKFFDGTFKSVMKGFDQITKETQQWGDKMGVESERNTKRFQYSFLAITEAAQQMYSFLREASDKNFDNEYENLERQYEVSRAFAGDDVVAQKETEKQYEERKKQIQNREAKANKDLALFNIALNTAQGAVAAYPNLILAGLILALGAVQYSNVASKNIPQYWKGTDNHIGGDMIINDGKGSDFQEVVQTPDGKTETFTDRNVLLNRPRGTKVFTQKQWKAQLDSMLIQASLSYSQSAQYTGPGIQQIGIDKSDLHSMGNSIVSAIQNKREYHPSFDKKGFGFYVQDGHTRRELLNNEVTFTGTSV